MRIAVELVRLLSKRGVTSLTPVNIFTYLNTNGIPNDSAELAARYLAGNKIRELAGQYNLTPEGARKRLMATIGKMENF